MVAPAGRARRSASSLCSPASANADSSCDPASTTAAPLDARQLGRLSLRAGAGLARTGSVFGHGSGDIALAFSTAYTVPHLADVPMPAVQMVHETRLDPLFRAAADSVEQAIVNALWHGETVHGRDGHTRRALRELLQELMA